MEKGYWVGPERRPTVLKVQVHLGRMQGPGQVLFLWLQSCHLQVGYGTLPCRGLRPLGGAKAIMREETTQSHSMTTEQWWRIWKEWGRELTRPCWGHRTSTPFFTQKIIHSEDKFEIVLLQEAFPYLPTQRLDQRPPSLIGLATLCGHCFPHWSLRAGSTSGS